MNFRALQFGFHLPGIRIHPPTTYNLASMVPVLQQHPAEVALVCRRFDVLRLEAFGSAVKDGGRQFDPNASDLDFLVLFRRDSPKPPDERYFGLLHSLQSLFGRDADLVDITAARNPYFVAEALKHRVTLYAA